MKRKGLLCAILVLILLFSAQPATASNAGNMKNTVISITKCRMPIVRVLVPTTGRVYINPLKFPIYIGDSTNNEQIVSTPLCLANMSDAPVKVDVTVTGTVKADSAMSLATHPTGGTGTNKAAFVYFEIQQGNSDDMDKVEWDSAYDASKHLMLVNGVPVTKKDITTLPAMTLDGDIAEGGYAPFRLAGDVVTAPTEEWTNKDGIDVIVAFTFTPLPYGA